MTCRHCGTEIADKALICYRCGNATTEARIAPPAVGSLFDRSRRRSRRPLVVVLAILVLLLAIAWLFLRNDVAATGLRPPVPASPDVARVALSARAL